MRCVNPWDEVDERIDLESALRTLTPRQERVVRLWLAGYTQAEIGQKMGVTNRMIRYHFANIRGHFLFALRNSPNR